MLALRSAEIAISAVRVAFSRSTEPVRSETCTFITREAVSRPTTTAAATGSRNRAAGNQKERAGRRGDGVGRRGGGWLHRAHQPGAEPRRRVAKLRGLAEQARRCLELGRGPPAPGAPVQVKLQLHRLQLV